jgi:transposase-like protein
MSWAEAMKREAGQTGLDVLVQRRRDRHAAKRLLRKLLKRKRPASIAFPGS